MIPQIDPIRNIIQRFQEFRERNNVLKRGQNGNSFEVPLDMISKIFKKKVEVYNLLDVTGGYYLPPLKEFNAKFLKNFLIGTKRLLKKSDIISLGKIPRFEELAMKSIFKTIENDCNTIFFYFS